VVGDDESLGKMSGLLDEGVTRLKGELMTFLLDQRAAIKRAGEEAAAGERRHGMKRVALKQREVEAAAAELARVRGQKSRLEDQVANTAQACGRLRHAVNDKVQLLHLWNLWKAHVQRNKNLRALVKIGIERFQSKGLAKKCLREWHLETLRAKIDALRREFDADLAQATEDYRREAEAKEAEHQAQLDEVKEALVRERELRVKLEEDMRQAFMRGVCALNLEAINVFKQGVPHPLFNPGNPPLVPSAEPQGNAGAYEAPAGPAPGAEALAERIQRALESASTNSFYATLHEMQPRPVTAATPHPQ